MRLRYQLMIGFLASLIPVMLLLLILALHNTRHFQNQQLVIHAQDTATSLGLSLSAVLPDDLAMADTMINAIFDSGYYRYMSLADMHGQVLLERQNPDTIEGVPAWFVHMFTLDPPAANTEISNGWQRVAVLTVDSHPGVGYRKLWAFTLFLGGSVLLATMLLIGVIWLLLRVILTPLHAIEKQAKSLTGGEFVSVDSVPRTPEIAHVVMALNKMSRTLGNQFKQLASRADQLRETAYLDPDTGLGNAHQAQVQIDEMLADPEAPGFGYLVLLELASQRDILDREGESQAVQELRTVVAMMQHHLRPFPSCKMFRVRESELLVVVPFAHRPEVEQYATELTEGMTAHQSPLHTSGVGYVTACVFRHGERYSELKKRLEAALNVARQEKTNSYYIPPSGEPLPSSDELTPEGLTALLQPDNLTLHAQPIICAQSGEPEGYELLPRFTGERGQTLPTGQVVGMAEKLNQVEQLDRLVIVEGLNQVGQIHKMYKQGQANCWYSLNVSIHSLQSAHFLRWLRNELMSVRSLLPNIRLELHETGLLQDLAVAEQFVDAMRELGVGCAIDHFGINLASFAYLKQLRPHAIKVDGCHVRGIDGDQGNQMFLQVLIQLAKGLEIRVIAGQIESQGEWDQLKQLGVELGQGYFLGHPKQLETGS